MKIEHVAIWARNIEKLRAFYETYFSAIANDKYTNTTKGFESYFLAFESGPRLELMQLNSMTDQGEAGLSPGFGLAHFAFSVGSKEAVDALTERLRKAGYEIVDDPRTTGDGYYESVVLDPEGNRLELTK